MLKSLLLFNCFCTVLQVAELSATVYLMQTLCIHQCQFKLKGIDLIWNTQSITFGWSNTNCSACTTMGELVYASTWILFHGGGGMACLCIPPVPEYYSKAVQVVEGKDYLPKVKPCSWFWELASLPLHVTEGVLFGQLLQLATELTTELTRW